MRNKEGRALLDHEANLRAQMTKYSVLAILTGYSEQYVANYVARRVREKHQKVDHAPRGTRQKVHIDIGALAAELRKE